MSEFNYKIIKDVIREKYSSPSLITWGSLCVLDWIQIGTIFYFVDLKINLPLTIILAGIFLGIKQHSLAMLMHDAAHGTITRKFKLNDLICNLAICYPLFDHLDIFRSVHMLHHWRAGDVNADPELIFKNKFKSNYDFPFNKLKVLKLFLKDVVGLSYMESVWFSCFRERKKIKKEIPLIVFWLIIIFVFLLFFPDKVYFLIIWIWVKLGPFVAISRLRMMTEHSGDAKIFPHRFTINPILGWLITPHNTYHHYEHHCFPSVPCWNLKQVRKLMNSNDPPIMSTAELYEKIF